MLSVAIFYYCAECHYAKCCYAECRDFFIVVLSVAMLNVVMLGVMMLILDIYDKENQNLFSIKTIQQTDSINDCTNWQYLSLIA